MVISKVVGGLGNQMFQYAAARRLALKKNTVLKLDISGYKTEGPRSFLLDKFNIQAAIASPEETAFFRRYQKRNLTAKALNIWQRFLPPSRRNFVKEERLDFDPSVLKLSGNVYLQGYWQSEKYFQDVSGAIRSDFVPQKTPTAIYHDWLQKIQSGPSVAVHVRRTDYLKLCDLYPVCQPEFYARAAKILAEKENDQLRFFVFSDDIGWAKENLKFDAPAEFVSQSSLKDIDELLLMSKCRHNITANSSFSWWGAWLNENPKKIVIAPKERLKGKNNPKSKDIYPPSWIII